MVSAQKKLWSEYYRYHKIKVRQKEISIWNGVTERYILILKVVGKSFWRLLVQDRKGRKRLEFRSIAHGQILQSHYEHLGKVSEGSDFDDD